MNRYIKIFNDAEQLAKATAEIILTKALEKKDVNKKLYVAISGGSTPIVLFKLLAKAYEKLMPWELIQFYWVDERCVPSDDKDSNYGAFIAYMPKDIILHSERIIGEANPDEEVERYEKLLNRIPNKNGLPLFDIVLLGMGEDGHTASLFPHQMDLLTSNNLCEVAEHPITSQKRITITKSVINNAEDVIFLVTGEKKAEIAKKILQEEGRYLQYPAAYIYPKLGNLMWFLDKNAAKLLNE